MNNLTGETAVFHQPFNHHDITLLDLDAGNVAGINAASGVEIRCKLGSSADGQMGMAANDHLPVQLRPLGNALGHFFLLQQNPFHAALLDETALHRWIGLGLRLDYAPQQKPPPEMANGEAGHEVETFADEVGLVAVDNENLPARAAVAQQQAIDSWNAVFGLGMETAVLQIMITQNDVNPV